jgi:membrane protein
MRAYDRGGGDMLAGALAYYAFFTMVPALLLFVGLLGVFVEDAAVRAQVVTSLVDQVDPIAEVATVVVDGLAGSGRTSTIIGLLGLLWGASGFYGALESSMARTFPGPGSRDFLHTRLRGLLAVALVLGGMVAAVIVIFGLPLVQAWLEQRCDEIDALRIPLVEQACQVDLGMISAVGAILVTIAVASVVSLVVYVVVPTDGATLRQALPAALLVGVVIGVLTSLFGLFAPILVREWLTLGVVGSVFIALIWFRLVFQALLYGAAFARLRRDRDRTFQGRPVL